MSYTAAVVITGAAGGIGKALCDIYSEAGWYVIATGRKADAGLSNYFFIEADLEVITYDAKARLSLRQAVIDACGDISLKALVNNAALQILGPTEELTANDFTKSFAVNTLAPFLLTQTFLHELESNAGSVLNIGTVHAQATKPGFTAYATTKTAMHGLTRALAVDLGGRVRVNTLAPAATATPMLMAGFKGKEESFKQLAKAHPVGRIAEPSEIGKAALFLTSDDAGFITGGTYYIDGGVLARLHDPE